MRLNYTACLVEIQRVFDISKSQAGLPITGSFLVYGVGQLLCFENILPGQNLSPIQIRGIVISSGIFEP